jgi:hypothetical protein
MLDDVVLRNREDALRLCVCLERDTNLFITEWKGDFGWLPRSKTLSLLPATKLDTEHAKAVVNLGYPAVGLILREIIDWLGDINWPVAQVFAPFLATVGEPLRPLIKGIFETSDDVLKYNIIQHVAAHSPALRNSLEADLRRIAKNPRPGEKREECDLVAQEILNEWDTPAGYEH